MSQTLCLNRECLGLVTRIECIIRPLSGGNGLWTLLCAAGIDAGQPTAIKAQGPFRGPREAESVLKAIAENLYGQGYAESEIAIDLATAHAGRVTQGQRQPVALSERMGR